MINDIDKTIENLLKKNLPQKIANIDINDLHISFDRPDNTFTLSPAVNIFLYNIEENIERRSSRMAFVQGKNDPGTNKANVKNYPPINVSFSYIITAWATSIAEEHAILGELMKVLVSFPRIPAEALSGTLEGLTPLPYAYSILPDSFEDIGGFWQTIGWVKPSLNYKVMLDVDVHKAQEVRLVKKVDTTFATK